MGDYQGWFLQVFNNICHGKGFAAAGNAQKDLIFFILFEVFCQLRNCSRLITGWFIIRAEREFQALLIVRNKLKFHSLFHAIVPQLTYLSLAIM